MIGEARILIHKQNRGESTRPCRDDCAKQSQFAGAKMNNNCCDEKDLGEKDTNYASAKTKPISRAGVSCPVPDRVEGRTGACPYRPPAGVLTRAQVWHPTPGMAARHHLVVAPEDSRGGFWLTFRGQGGMLDARTLPMAWRVLTRHGWGSRH